MSAAALMEVVEALGAPYGLERSCKITAGAVQEDRFLASLHRSAFGADVTQGLLAAARRLCAPEDFLDAIAAAQAEADIVHLGYEGGLHATYKIYLEYAAQVRRAQAQANPEPVLVHLAFKWVPAAAGRHVITRYTWAPTDSRADIAGKVRGLLSAAAAPRALAGVLELLERGCARTDARNLFLMEVEEPGNARRSCDLNLYQADLCLRDVADVMDALGGLFAVPRQEMVALLGRCGALALGHVAGGCGRDGAEFVTLYYGVEAHG